MEKGNVLVMNGGINLPIGFRFCPTDEELVVHYLKRKVFSRPLPALVIPEFDLFDSHPRRFPGDKKETRYFFCKRRTNSSRYYKCKTKVGYCYWKPIGKERQILDSCSDQTVGVKRTLVFKEPNNKSSHRWIMHEYCLVDSDSVSAQICGNGIQDWAVLKLFRIRSNRRAKRSQSGELFCKSIKQNGVELLGGDCGEGGSEIGPPQPSSPSWNGATENLSDGLDNEEEASSVTFSF